MSNTMMRSNDLFPKNNILHITLCGLFIKESCDNSLLSLQNEIMSTAGLFNMERLKVVKEVMLIL